jgi:hypothetical protein
MSCWILKGTCVIDDPRSGPITSFADSYECFYSAATVASYEADLADLASAAGCPPATSTPKPPF